MRKGIRVFLTAWILLLLLCGFVAVFGSGVVAILFFAQAAILILAITRSHWGWHLAAGAVVLVGLVSLATPFLVPFNVAGYFRRWEPVLIEEISGCDRVRVRTGGLCHRDETRERMLFELRGESAVSGVADMIDVHPAHSGFHCMCCGNPTLEFYHGEALVASVGFHHGRSLRWRGWDSDVGLTLRSQARLSLWLQENGVDLRTLEMWSR